MNYILTNYQSKTIKEMAEELNTDYNAVYLVLWRKGLTAKAAPKGRPKGTGKSKIRIREKVCCPITGFNF